MTEAGALKRLAMLAGIVPSYHDAWGNERHVPERTQRALLEAMGFHIGNAEQIERHILDIVEVPFRQPLPPVLVVRRPRNANIQISISLSARRATAPIEWRFEMESGAAYDGRMTFSNLITLEERSIDGETMERRALQLEFPIELGYHRFRLFLPDESVGERATLPVIVTPSRCWQPRGRQDRIWGMALQLYALRSNRNWGIGDFSDLAAAAQTGGPLGASAVGLNPLHALFPETPQHASPYSPSHREFLSVWYIDVEMVPDFAECDEAQRMIQDPQFHACLEKLRATPFVDHAKVATAKRPVLELLYRNFCRNHLGPAEGGAKSERAAAFRRYQKLKGRSLEELGLFQALSEHFGGSKPWRQWPRAYHDPASREVSEFNAAYRERVEFFQYLQWQADLQLAKASEAAGDAGMAVGLYHDLALAPDGSGAEAWAGQSMFAQGVRLGAPPDEWNHKGQDWGLPPYNPHALNAAAYAPVTAVLRANMRHAGALRMDHAMGLQRMYWIPEGAGPQDGAYVRYPVDDLFGVLALESHRQRCIVIGEDLGTVPEGFHERMRAAAMLSYRLLYFSQDEKGEFLNPRRYPAPSAVAVSTHDLATLAGFWHGRDLEVRAELGLYPSEAAKRAARKKRTSERTALVRALKREELLPPGVPDDSPEFSFDLVTAVCRFLARTPARLLLLSPGDVFGEEDQINMPGTVTEYPNWKRKLLVELEQWERDPRMVAVAEAINMERARSRHSLHRKRGKT